MFYLFQHEISDLSQGQVAACPFFFSDKVVSFTITLMFFLIVIYKKLKKPFRWFVTLGTISSLLKKNRLNQNKM